MIRFLRFLPRWIANIDQALFVSGLIIVTVCFGCSRSPQHEEKPQMESETQSLIRTINDDADILHSDYTPSVNRLIEIGMPSVDPVLELMLSDDEETRVHAQRVLTDITARQHGFTPGRGWSVRQQHEWRDFWIQLGALNWNDPIEKRRESVRLWREWLSTQQK